MPKSDQRLNHPRYQVIPRTLIFLFDHLSRVLLLKGAPDKRLWAGKYNGIGGHLESHESVLEGALRELKEETGIEGVGLWLCAQIMVTVNDQQGVALFVFKGEVEDVPLTDSIEGTLEWVDMIELGELPLVEDLKVILPKVATQNRAAGVLFGKSYYDDQDRLVVTF